MDPKYKELQKQADSLHSRYLGMRDAPDDQLAVWLDKQTKEIREDLEQGKAPRSVETRVLEVLKQLEHAKSEPSPAISQQDAGALRSEYEHLREKLRGLSNY